VHSKQEYCGEAALHTAENFQLHFIQTTKDEFLQVSKLNTPRGHALIKRKGPYDFSTCGPLQGAQTFPVNFQVSGFIFIHMRCNGH
jgi:hypothetical protein